MLGLDVASAVGLLSGALGLGAAWIQTVGSGTPPAGAGAARRRLLGVVVLSVVWAVAVGVTLYLHRQYDDDLAEARANPLAPHGQIISIADGDPVSDYPLKNVTYEVDHVPAGYTPWFVVQNPTGKNLYNPRQAECTAHVDGKQACDRLYIGEDNRTRTLTRDQDFDVLLLLVDDTGKKAIEAYHRDAVHQNWPGMHVLKGRYMVLDAKHVVRRYSLPQTGTDT